MFKDKKVIFPKEIAKDCGRAWLIFWVSEACRTAANSKMLQDYVWLLRSLENKVDVVLQICFSTASRRRVTTMRTTAF